MARLKLVLFKSKEYNDGSHPIMIRLTHKSKLKYIYTGHTATPKEWNYDENLPKKPALRNLISNKLTNAENALFEIEKKGKPFTLDELTAKVKIKESDITFYQYAEQVIKDEKKAQKFGNAEVYKTTLNVIKTFTENRDFKFENLDLKWLKEFETHHLNKEDNTVGGLNVYLRIIRALYNRAIQENVVDKEFYPFGRGKYVIHSTSTGKKAISKESINKIRSLDLSKHPSLWHARNYMLFMFYCRGMNFVDLAFLKIKNIVSGRVEYIRTKTKRKYSKSFTIKITPQMQEIIDIYQGGKSKDDYLFPIISRKKADDVRKDIKNELKTFNKYFKELGKRAEITEDTDKLSSYTIRHTWATIGKQMGHPIANISDGLGHADMHTTQVYLDSIEDDELDKMSEEITG